MRYVYDHSGGYHYRKKRTELTPEEMEIVRRRVELGKERMRRRLAERRRD